MTPPRITTGSGHAPRRPRLALDDAPALAAVSASGAATIAWKPSKRRSQLRTARASRRLLDLEIYTADAVRKTVNYPKKPHYHGECTIASTGQAVFYESMLERRALHWLDITQELVSVSTQPMQITFDDGSVHFPDILALHADHRQVLYDVKPAKFVPKFERQFANTRAMCERVGWGYELITGFSPAHEQNLELLAGHGGRLFRPSERMRQQILAAVDGPTRIADAARAVDPEHRNAAIPAIHHLICHRQLRADLDRAVLTTDTLIRKPTL